MTISSTTVRNSYSGDGSTTTFSYTFKIFAESDLQVIIRSSTGTETTKTITTHYTVTGVGVSGGGSVIFTSGNIPTNTETVVLRRNVPQTQSIDYIANDPFPAESHEEGLDRSMMVAQQIQEELGRAIKLSRTNTITSTEFTANATSRANKVFSFDSSGELSITQELGTFKGNWSASTAYLVRDLIKDTSTGNIFICITAHTSSGSEPITSNVDSAKWSLIVDNAAASANANAAANHASNSSNFANNSSNSSNSASNHSANSSNFANNSSNHASNSSNHASNAANHASNAANSAAAAAASAETFDDVYLGAKASDPTLDNDGDPLTAGDLYYNTTSGNLKYYTGSAWIAVTSGGITDVVQDTTPQLGGDLDVNTYKLVSTSNGNIELQPNGTGDVYLSADTVRIGDSNTDAVLTTNGTGDITINTNSGTNSGTVKIFDGANANIEITPNGTGVVKLDGLSYPTADGTANQVLKTDGSGVLSFTTLTSDGTADWDTTVKTSAFTATANKGYFCNTTSAAFTVTLPATPTAGDEVVIVDYAGTFATNKVTLAPNGNKIESGTGIKTLTTNREATRIVYIDSTQGWISYSGANEGSQNLDPNTYSVDFLVIAGGGGSGRGNGSLGGNGGGGAGGYRNSYSSETSGGGGSSETELTLSGGTVYTVTIGAGGTGQTGSNGKGGNGVDSSISGTGITTITSTGGGGGGVGVSGLAAGNNGGSGGGAAAGSTAGNGTANQGSNGGGGTGAGGGGGGGANAAGAAASSASGGAGGNGLASSITGSSVSRGGGGGGANNDNNPGAAGGTGGGGAAATNSSTAGTVGTVNTGGGAGASGYSSINGVNGGSGVVILRMLTANYSGTTTGSPTVSTDGSDTILVFNASGSYTG